MDVDTGDSVQPLSRAISERIVADHVPSGMIGIKLSSPTSISKLYVERSVLVNDTSVKSDLELLHGKKWVINPNSRFRVYWDMLIMIFVTINVVAIPVDVAFREDVQLDGLFYFNVVMDIFFLVDMIVNFHTAFRNQDNVLITDRKEIAMNYLRGVFTVDILSIMPIDYLMLAIVGPHSNAYKQSRVPRILRLMRLVRLLRLQRLLRYFMRYESDINLSVIQLYLAKALFLIILLVHWNTCLRYFEASLHGFRSETWVARNDIFEYSTGEKYIFALFSVLSMMVGDGWGTYPYGGPMLKSEQWVVIYCMLFGGLAWQAFSGVYQTMLVSIDPVTQDRLSAVAGTKQYMRYSKLPPNIQQRMEAYVRQKHAKFVFDEDELLEELPLSLRRVISVHNSCSLLEKLAFIKNPPPSFVIAFAPLLRSTFVMVGEVVVWEGEPKTKLYIVDSGSAIVTRKGQKIAELGPGDMFGDVSILFDVKQPVTITTSVNCDLVYLEADSFAKLFAFHPSLLESLKSQSFTRLQEWSLHDSLHYNWKGLLSDSDLFDLKAFLA